MYLNSVSVSYNITYMKHIFLLLILILATAQANLGSFDSNGKFIYPETNQPFTGNLDVINNDWGVDAVEFNKDYVDGLLHGNEKVNSIYTPVIINDI